MHLGLYAHTTKPRLWTCIISPHGPNRLQHPPLRAPLRTYPGSGRLCSLGKQQRRAFCAPTRRRYMHLGKHNQATLFRTFISPQSITAHPLTPPLRAPLSTGYFKISPSHKAREFQWLCFSTCSTSLTQSCRGLLGKIAHALLFDWSAIAYFPSFPQSCNFLPVDVDASSWRCATAGRG